MAELNVGAVGHSLDVVSPRELLLTRGVGEWNWRYVFNTPDGVRVTRSILSSRRRWRQHAR